LPARCRRNRERPPCRRARGSCCADIVGLVSRVHRLCGRKPLMPGRELAPSDPLAEVGPSGRAGVSFVNATRPALRGGGRARSVAPNVSRAPAKEVRDAGLQPARGCGLTGSAPLAVNRRKLAERLPRLRHVAQWSAVGDRSEPSPACSGRVPVDHACHRNRAVRRIRGRNDSVQEDPAARQWEAAVEDVAEARHCGRRHARRSRHPCLL